MNDNSLTVDIRKVAGATSVAMDDFVAVEEPLEIQLGALTAAGSAAKSISITMRTPGDDVELALGFLLTEGIIQSAEQVIDISHRGPAAEGSGRQNSIRINLHPDLDIAFEKLQRHFYTTSSCGVCGKASLDALYVAGQISLIDQKTSFSRDMIVALPDRVREKQSLFESTGGLHAAAVFDAHGEILVVKEDVGRHNATDKAIGALLVAGKLPGHQLGLLVSGRASFELMQKALVAGIPLLAAVGAPSSLAVSTAREFGMTLIGFLRNGSFNIYAGEQRLSDGE
jgi:FdhD protein